MSLAGPRAGRRVRQGGTAVERRDESARRGDDLGRASAALEAHLLLGGVHGHDQVEEHIHVSGVPWPRWSGSSRPRAR